MASPNAAGTSGAKESSLTTLISQLERRSIPYFYKVMKKSAVTAAVLGPLAYALEFPLSFIRAHDTELAPTHVTFQPTNCDQAWPIAITVKEEPGPKNRVFAYGLGGWKAFVVQNDVQVGDTLVFSLVAFSKFVIDIIKAPPVEDQEEEDPSFGQLPSLQNIEEASVRRKRRKRGPPQGGPQRLCKRCKEVPVPQVVPRFVKGLKRFTDTDLLVVPVDFWECFRDRLQSEELQLEGPNGVVMMVKVRKVSDEEELRGVHLLAGWNEFFVASKMRIGDVLEFSLTGPSCFTVDVL